jgi:FkbM family methyltransferase
MSARLKGDYPEVEVHGAAVSDHTGHATFYRVPRRPARSGLRPIDRTHGPVEQLTVALETLDSSLPSGYVPALIKIDVEGAEEQVLNGAVETLTRHRPVVILEHHRAHSRAFGTTPSRIHALLSEMAGLRIYDINGDGPLRSDQFAMLVESGRMWTWLARP